ncbi:MULTISPECIES: type II toxin-antitoxin system RelE/ParE family toxin [unclassified Mesorhizobium]|uniref:type II toxin-antitoxin system RelE/ParE family toxin n=1 Tax=unclassified Mesorhizobium TaxID=325217 RepID=UPI00301547BB
MAELRIVRSPAAEDDLIDIWCGIAPDNPVAADRFLDSIAAKIKQLATFPDSGPLRPDIAPDARALTVGNYLVLYRHTGTHIEIVRVVHGARDLTALL